MSGDSPSMICVPSATETSYPATKIALYGARMDVAAPSTGFALRDGREYVERSGDQLLVRCAERRGDMIVNAQGVDSDLAGLRKDTNYAKIEILFSLSAGATQISMKTYGHLYNLLLCHPTRNTIRQCHGHIVFKNGKSTRFSFEG